ncbi:MAG: hypothetical protein FJ137_06550 [Deltaproteobacteria bacterium]|nr:hypothetical protein [Deltaproteobacteria bacterium]
MTPRGHAAARLQARARPTAADRGFRLLRDRDALGRFLAQRAAADARLAVDVIALALEPGDAPALALVDRAGHGVTCLARGMTTSAPIVPWPMVAAFLDDQERLLSARRAALAAHGAGPDHSPLVRAVEHPHRLVRDEVLALRALLPLVGVTHHAAAVEAAVDEVIAVATGLRASDAALQASWRLLQGGVTSLVVAGDDGALFGPALAAIASGEPRLGVPALWQLVHHPARTLALGHALVDVDNPIAHDALLDTVLPALALRGQGFARDADAVARRAQARRGIEPTGLGDVHELAVEFTRQLLVLLPLVLRHACPDDVVIAHRADVEALALRLRAARGVPAVEALASPWAAEALRCLGLPRRRLEPPRTAPRPLASLPDDERRALALWRGMVLAPPLPLRGAGPVFALLVAHAPVEALLPGDEPDPQLALGRGVAWLRQELPRQLGLPASPTAAKRRRRRH